MGGVSNDRTKLSMDEAWIGEIYFFFSPKTDHILICPKIPSRILFSKKGLEVRVVKGASFVKARWHDSNVEGSLELSAAVIVYIGSGPNNTVKRIKMRRAIVKRGNPFGGKECRNMFLIFGAVFQPRSDPTARSGVIESSGFDQLLWRLHWKIYVQSKLERKSQGERDRKRAILRKIIQERSPL